MKAAIGFIALIICCAVAYISTDKLTVSVAPKAVAANVSTVNYYDIHRYYYRQHRPYYGYRKHYIASLKEKKEQVGIINF